MNLPNALTVLRISLVPVFLVVLLSRMPWGAATAAVVFVAASLTDLLDGYLARKQRTVTTLGKFLDPLADKLLVSAALIALVELGQLSTWVAIVIIGRELAVTGMRSIAAAEGVIIAAGPLGKTKTAAQAAFIVAALLAQAIPAAHIVAVIPNMLVSPLVWIAVSLTIWSGIDYGRAYWLGVDGRSHRSNE